MEDLRRDRIELAQLAAVPHSGLNCSRSDDHIEQRTSNYSGLSASATAPEPRPHRSHRDLYARVARINSVSPPTDTPAEPIRSASLARSSEACSAARTRWLE